MHQLSVMKQSEELFISQNQSVVSVNSTESSKDINTGGYSLHTFVTKESYILKKNQQNSQRGQNET